MVLLFATSVMGPTLSAASAPLASATPPAPIDSIQQRAAACTSCHGERGEGSAEGSRYPRLAGKPVGYLTRQLQDFQSGLRTYPLMEHAVRGLNGEYMQELAGYFSRQNVPYRRVPVPSVSTEVLRRGELLVNKGDPARGVPACGSCHGSELTGVEPYMPGLVGLSYDYISAQLGAWRNKTRATAAPDCMAVVANRLQVADVTAVAAFLASRETPLDMHAQAAGVEPPPPSWCVLGVTGAAP